LKTVTIEKKKIFIKFEKEGILKKIVLISKNQNKLFKLLNNKIEKIKEEH